MSKESELIEQTEEFLESVWDELQELIDAEAEEVGIPCPCCCANKLVDESRTRMMRDVFEVSKTNPLYVYVLMKRASVFHQGMADTIAQLMEMNADLFELNSDEEKE